MKRLYYFLKNYKLDLLTLFFAIISAILAYCFMSNQKILMRTSIIIAVVFLLVIIYIRKRERDFIFSALTWRKDIESWIGYGEFKYNRVHNAYAITKSESGFIN
jgi:hypothetical protein